MKFAYSIFVSVLLGTFLVSSALDMPKSSIVSDLGSSRELQLQDLAETACDTRLVACQAAIKEGPYPYEEWSEILGRLDLGENSTVIVDLRYLIANVTSIDFGELARSIGAITVVSTNAAMEDVAYLIGSTGAALREGLVQLQEEPEQIFENGINFFTNFLIHSLELFSGIIQFDVKPLTNLIRALGVIGDLAIKVAFALPSGPLAVIGVLVTNLAPIMTDFLVGLVNQFVGPGNPDSSALCASNVIQCSVDRMALNVLPALVEAIFIVQGKEEKRLDTFVSGP